jgi:hypothetical protein
MFGMCDDERPLIDAIRNSTPLMFGASDKERIILDLVGLVGLVPFPVYEMILYSYDVMKY